jgi:pyruvate formate lyase activating enzyme
MRDRPALFHHRTEDGREHCWLCPRLCLIPPGAAGACGVRANTDGSLKAISYGRVSSVALDPIEKKPLARFHPGARILSVGGFGCNLRCPFCQNHAISLEYDMSKAACYTPEAMASLAVRTVADGNIGLAYTYNEPVVGFEFMYDCAVRIREAGLLNVMITNGYVTKDALRSILPLTDAVNIDVKGFTQGFYRKLGGELEPVKETVVMAARHCHTEVTTLVIPGENDEDIAALAGWIASVDPHIPLHLSRFFPRYRYAGREPTPTETLLRLCETARRSLHYVYAGNM